MPKGKKGVDGIDKVIDLFPAGSHKMIERLLARAADREARQAGQNVRAAMRALGGRGGRSGGKVLGGLASNLAKALRQRGDVGGGRASIRQKAPDTGGRPFHFAHSVISKEDGAPSASGRAPTGAKGAGSGGPGGTGLGKTGRAAAHMRYIEREIAVERTYGQGVDEIERAADGRVAERVEEGERSVGHESVGTEGQVHATSATAGQGYIENPVKLANGEQVIFSFGTIGDRFEDRVRFWEALEEAEAHPQARVQHRLIVELPHEATPAARHEMMRAFAKRFEDDGIPYWAALHAPGKDNDSRNFHAHIVYSQRPARRMVDPDVPGGHTQWDFAITKTYKKKSRNVVTTRPYRQEKLRSYHARDFIPTIRKEFSETVNAVLTRDEVKDAKGQKVLYDARSYKSMGVDAVPMRSINRIVADKMKEGQQTVLDGDYTRRMITAELRDAAAKRQKGVMDLIALDNALRATTATSRPQEQNGKLPRDLRISPWASPGKAALRAAGRKILEARHAALQIDVMERATTASLDRIIAATSPKAVEAAARNRDPVAKAEAAAPDAALMLHAAALDELAETRSSSAKARSGIAYRIGNAVNEWRALVQAKPPEISPAVKAAIRQMDLREERAERASKGAREVGAPTGRTAARSGSLSAAPTSAAMSPTSAVKEATGERAASGRATPPPRPATGSPGTEAGDAKHRDATKTTTRASGAEARPTTASRSERTVAGLAVASAGRREGGSARAAEVGDVAPQARADARASHVAPLLRPTSMEDVLRVRMPPTVPELEAASRAVSELIRAVTEGENDVDVRIRKVELLVDTMKADVRKRQGLPPLEGDALKPTSMRLEESSSPGQASPKAGGRVEASPADAARAASGPRGDGSTTVPTVPRTVGIPVACGELRPGGAVGSPGVAGGADQGPSRPDGEGRESAPEVPQVPENPDDVRRRKKRKEDLERRKRQRQAVLARKNRGKGR